MLAAKYSRKHSAADGPAWAMDTGTGREVVSLKTISSNLKEIAGCLSPVQGVLYSLSKALRDLD
jgi:hypothetical protein